MPGLFGNDINEPLLPTPHPSIHNFPQSLGHQGQNGPETQANVPGTGSCPSPGEMAGSLGHSSPIDGLLDLQPRLIRLALRFSQQSNTADDIEELYRATESMGHIMAQLEDPTAKQARGLWTNFSAIQALLLSSCYFSLVQAYQCLTEVLSAQINRSTPEIGHAASSELACPTISVGGLKLSMPRKAAAEVNLYLAAQRVQHIRCALERCTKRNDNVRDSCDNMALGVDDEATSEGPDTMKDMVDQAVEQLRDGEERLLDNLHALVGVTNNEMFNLR